jgi:hypothetical protein
MSLTGTIRRRDRRPLGTVEEVKRHLSEAFPGTRFTYVASKPPGAAAIRWPLRARLLFAVFGTRTRYPHHSGLFERTLGDPAAVQFYFEASEPVRWIRATSYGMTSGLDESFARLSAATGWVTVYPRF